MKINLKKIINGKSMVDPEKYITLKVKVLKIVDILAFVL
jgi:hypothetical protein